MSVELVLRAVEIFRANGVPVTFEPGWDRRGNGQTSAYQGGIEHHTAGGYNATCPAILIQGRSDLAGPLCNFAGLSGGGIHVVAAHPANHAGASGGPSNGPFPRTTLFNRLVMGLEICYPGNQPMTDAQYRTAKVFAFAMKVLFGSVERCRAHAETSIEGKWDPGYAPGKTINMGVLRADAANLQEGDEFMGALTDKQQTDMAAAVSEIRDVLLTSAKGPVVPGRKPETVHDIVSNTAKETQAKIAEGVPVALKLSAEDRAAIVADVIAGLNQGVQAAFRNSLQNMQVNLPAGTGTFSPKPPTGL